MAKLGLQLYTVIDEARRDFFVTIRRIAALGYEGVEFPGGTRDLIRAGELRAQLEETNLAMAGIVFSIKELEEELDSVVDYCRGTMCDTVVVPWIDEQLRTAQGYCCVAQKFNQWGMRLRTEGINLLYHVHGYEFGDIGGITGMEVLTGIMDPGYVNLEIDVYWVEHGGQDAVAFMKRYGSRSPSIHFKDMTDRHTFTDTEVGAGCIDMVAIAVEGLRNHARWFIVEQEAFDTTPMQSVKISLANLKKISAAANRSIQM